MEEALKGLAHFAEVSPFPIPQEHSTVRLWWDHIRSLLAGRTYTVFTYESKKFAERLSKELASQTYDLVHLDSLDLSGYLPHLRALPTVCVHHDAQSVLLKRRAAYQDSRLTAKYVQHQSKLMEKEEKLICPAVDLNVTVSETDRGALRRIAPAGRYEVVPNGVDTNYFVPMPSEESGVVFVGGTTWYPNKDALEYYRTAIIPELRARVPNVHTVWVGRASEQEIQGHSSAQDRLELTGYVKDVRPFIAAAACYVVPIRIGGGTRIKILDAWAMGKAVVSTSIGCEGLDAQDGENILIADTPSEFAERVGEVVEDPDLRHRLGRNARRTVEERYGWDAIGRHMNGLYLDLISRA